MQILQARSFKRYVTPGTFCNIFFIYNDTDTNNISKLRDIIANVLGKDFSFNFLDYRCFGISPEDVDFDGWITQQAIKMLASDVVASPRYVVFDAKNHFILPVGKNDFVAPNGKMRMPMREMRNFWDYDGYKFALEYFGVDIDHFGGLGIPNTTPFVTDTQAMKQVAHELQQRESMELQRLLAIHRGALMEFFAYQAFMGLSPHSLQDFYEPSAYLNVTIWQDIPKMPHKFEPIVDRVINGEFKSFAVHWRAIPNLMPSQRQRIIDLWLSRGLVEAFDDGEYILDATSATNTSDGG
jgi:Family of unknown function (DUF6492)